MISVIIPVFNRANLIATTINSLLNQYNPPGEIIVVDDGSTDASVQVAQSFGHPVRVIQQANQGPAAARNLGLSVAQGDWIHFFDSDDLALPDLHSLQLSAIHEAEADVAFSPWVKCLVGTRSLTPVHQVFQCHGLPRGNLIRALLTNWSVVPICCLVRASLARRVGGFPRDLHAAEDQLFFLRLLLAGSRVVHVPEALVVYREGNTDKLSAHSAPAIRLRHLRDWARFLLKARFECLQYGIDPCTWFDFRLRLWDARISIQSCADPADNELIQELLACEGPSWYQILYRTRRSIRRKGGGLTWRLIGRRSHRSFRSGPLSPSWQNQLDDLALTI